MCFIYIVLVREFRYLKRDLENDSKTNGIRLLHELKGVQLNTSPIGDGEAGILSRVYLVASSLKGSDIISNKGEKKKKSVLIYNR